jgi:hypothetical protein
MSDNLKMNEIPQEEVWTNPFVTTDKVDLNDTRVPLLGGAGIALLILIITTLLIIAIVINVYVVPPDPPVVPPANYLGPRI